MPVSSRIELGDVDAGNQRVEHVLALGDEPEGAADAVLRAAVRELEARVVGDDHRLDRALDQQLGRASRFGHGERAGKPATRVAEVRNVRRVSMAPRVIREPTQVRHCGVL